MAEGLWDETKGQVQMRGKLRGGRVRGFRADLRSHAGRGVLGNEQWPLHFFTNSQRKVLLLEHENVLEASLRR